MIAAHAVGGVIAHSSLRNKAVFTHRSIGNTRSLHTISPYLRHPQIRNDSLFRAGMQSTNRPYPLVPLVQIGTPKTKHTGLSALRCTGETQVEACQAKKLSLQTPSTTTALESSSISMLLNSILKRIFVNKAKIWAQRLVLVPVSRQKILSSTRTPKIISKT